MGKEISFLFRTLKCPLTEATWHHRERSTVKSHTVGRSTWIRERSTVKPHTVGRSTPVSQFHGRPWRARHPDFKIERMQCPVTQTLKLSGCNGAPFRNFIARPGDGGTRLSGCNAALFRNFIARPGHGGTRALLLGCSPPQILMGYV